MSKGRRRFLRAAAIVACLGSTVACGGKPQSAGPDCTSQLRFRGATYTAYRLTDQHSKKIGLATPTCSGKAVDGGHPVAVWSFPGQSPTQVLGRRGVRGRFAIYVADSVTLDERSRILRSMRTAH